MAAIAIPAQGETPRVAWRATIDGTPVYALIADRKLVVVTDHGKIFCWGEERASSPAAANPIPVAKGPYASPEKGYACLLVWQSPQQAEALARDGYRAVVLEPDPARVNAARGQLIETGCYGRQVQVLPVGAEKALLTPYWANLVVDQRTVDAAAETAITAALSWLRPYSGRMLLAGGPRREEILKRLLAPQSGYALETANDRLVVQRESPPAGSGDWTHEAGGAANCYASAERHVQWPLGVLWYSDDVDRYFTPAAHFQHQRQPFPLVVGGRMFLITG